MCARGLALAMSVCATVLGASLFAATPALAALETPENEKAGAVAATTATLEGVLNPKAVGVVEGGEYEFLYSDSPTECENAFVSPQSVALGNPKEAVSTNLTELQPSLKYTFCLVERNAAEEVVKGAPVTFETEAAPPTVDGESASAVTATGATLEAQVNPNNQTTSYSFEYSQTESGGKLTGTIIKIPGTGPLGGGTDQLATVPTDVLSPDTIYYYRVIAENAQSIKENIPVVGKVERFETISEAPETIAPVAGIVEIGSTTAVFHGVLNPHTSATDGWYFTYSTRGSCSGTSEHPGTTTPLEPEADAQAKSVSVSVTGLEPNANYDVCLVARNKTGETSQGTQIVFTTTGASNVGSSSVTLHAQVDPGGEPSTYFFEYGPTAAYGFATSSENAGAVSEPVPAFATIQNLQPDTPYHFRVVVSHAGGEARSADGGFSTFPVAQLGLPDGRQFEIVSPLENGDASVFTGGPVRAAADGTAVAYVGSPPPTGGTGSSGISASIRPSGTNVYLAKRMATGNWSAADIQPSGIGSNSRGYPVYEGFSNDLSVSLLSSPEPLLEGAPDEPVLYSRDEGDGNYHLLAAGGRFRGATASGGHVLVESDTGGLYDSTGEDLHQVSVLPTAEGGSFDTSATFGSSAGDFEHVISEPEGSRIFWTDTATGNLYVRENDTQPDASTTLIAGQAQYETASSDGSKVFFTDEEKLTVGSTATAGAPDLYEYDVGDRSFTDLSVASGGEHADIVGVLGASDDGSYVYFAAAGKLTADASVQECRLESTKEIGESIDTKCNIYVVHEGHPPVLVAVVAEPDGRDMNEGKDVVIEQGASAQWGDWNPVIGDRSAHVSADGQHLVFESVEDLTSSRVAGEGGHEIYMYTLGAGVSCISCNPSGASTYHGTPLNHQGFFAYAHAELPQSAVSTYALRVMSNDGDRVFFVSSEALVSQANEGGSESRYQEGKGLANVYEWEREGAGSCAVAVPSRSNDGCIFLLSQGTSSDISFFVDASESGGDVFLATKARLVPQDHGETFQVYDAHECTGMAPCPQEAITACSDPACQESLPPSLPVFATPASVTFSGIGNFPPSSPSPPVAVVKPKPKPVKCAKGKRRVHGKCVKSKKRARARKSANIDRRRAGR